MARSVYNLHNASLTAFYKEAEDNPEFYRKSKNPSGDVVDFIGNFVEDNAEEKGGDDKWISKFYKGFSELKKNPNEEYREILDGKYNKMIVRAISADAPVSVFNSEIKKIQESLKSDEEISEDEKIILNSALNIAIESYEYWYKST